MVPYQYTDLPGHRKQARLELRMDTSKRCSHEKAPPEVTRGRPTSKAAGLTASR